MVYAIVTKYTDGRTAVQYVDQKAVPASKTETRFIPVVDKRENVLYIEYAKAIHPERKYHRVDPEIVEIPLDGVQSVTIHNTEVIGGEYEEIPMGGFLIN